MELHITPSRGRHDGRVEAQRDKYATQLATSLPRSLSHLHDKRKGRSDDVAVVRLPNPTEAYPPFMLLHPRTPTARVRLLLLTTLGGSPCFS
jgi:hypothetical protein